jgi:hypothetical protein
MCATDLRNAVNCFGRIVQILRNKSCLAILYHFRHRPAVICDYGRPAGDGLNHYKTERFGPIDGKEQGVGITQKIIFFPIADLANPFHMRGLQQRFDDPFEIAFVNSINLGGNL